MSIGGWLITLLGFVLFVVGLFFVLNARDELGLGPAFGVVAASLGLMAILAGAATVYMASRDRTRSRSSNKRSSGSF